MVNSRSTEKPRSLPFRSNETFDCIGPVDYATAVCALPLNILRLISIGTHELPE